MLRLHLGIILTGLALACGVNSNNHRKASQIKAVDTTTANSTQTAAPTPTPLYESDRQFRVFDPLFDYNRYDTYDAAAMASRFPVVSADASQAAFIHYGPDFLRVRMQLLDAAQRSVRIQGLYFRGDESGNLIAQKLVALKQRGVQVDVIVDPLTSILPQDQAMYYYLQRNGITVQGFDFMYLNILSQVINTGGSLQQLFGVNQNILTRINAAQAILDKFKITNQRYHEKYFIVDAELPEQAIAIIGGTNIGNEYYGIESDKALNNWADRDIAIKGPIVFPTAAAFDRNLVEFKSRSQVLMSTLAGVSIWDLLNLANILPKANGPKTDANYNAKALDLLKTKTELNWYPSEMRFLQSRPRFREDLIYPAYIDFINRAEKSIDIMNAYFIPEETLTDALIQAARRGVVIRIVTVNANAIGLPKVTSLFTDNIRASFKRLLDANANNNSGGSIAIYEWGGDVDQKNGFGQNHAKYAIFDGIAGIVGSYNLDPRAHLLNSEDVVAFESADFAAELQKEFETIVTPGFSAAIANDQAKLWAVPETMFQRLRLQLIQLLTPYM